MVKIDCLLFGYRRLKVDAEDLSKLTSIFIRSGVFSSISDDQTVVVRERDLEKIKNLLKGRIEFTTARSRRSALPLPLTLPVI